MKELEEYAKYRRKNAQIFQAPKLLIPKSQQQKSQLIRKKRSLLWGKKSKKAVNPVSGTKINQVLGGS